MSGPSVGASIRLLVLEPVELRQDIDGNTDVVVSEAFDAVGVVEKNVGVEDEVFFAGGGQPVRTVRRGCPGLRLAFGGA